MPDTQIGNTVLIDQFEIVRKNRKLRKPTREAVLPGWKQIYSKDPDLNIDILSSLETHLFRYQHFNYCEIRFFNAASDKKWENVGTPKTVISVDITARRSPRDNINLRTKISTALAEFMKKYQDILMIRIDKSGVHVTRDTRTKVKNPFGPNHADFEPRSIFELSSGLKK